MGHEWDQPGEFAADKKNGSPGIHRRGDGRRELVPISEGSMEVGRYDLSTSTNRRFQAWCEVWATEALRVLKPGGHLLAFGGTRTSHRLVAGVEDAGFEIRDSVLWLYGSGFPKSLDVSKAIDKAAGAEREVVGQSASQGMALRPGASTYVHGGGEDRTAGTAADVTAPATPEVAQWEGWGTALKPAHEPIVVARKPLDGTVAANVLEHGTGGVNVEGCRIEGRERTDYGLAGAERSQGAVYAAPSTSADFDSSKGRWPANVILSEEAAVELDQQTGEVGNGWKRNYGEQYADEDRQYAGGVFAGGGYKGSSTYTDSGGASRFFYCAKTSTAERNAGLDGFPESSERRTAGRRLSDRKYQPVPAANDHPTVKPIELMRWLVRMVTPPGGTVLDPFSGSGTTGCAAVMEEVDFVGIEREAKYTEIARARILFWAKYPGVDVDKVLARLGKSNKARAKHDDGGQLGLQMQSSLLDDIV